MVDLERKDNMNFRARATSTMDLIAATFIESPKWAMVRKEFVNFTMNDIVYNWEASLSCGGSKKKRVVSWSPPFPRRLKLNVDGVVRDKLGPAGIGGVLRDENGALCLFSKGVELRDSNEAEVLAILEVLRILSSSFQGSSIVESDSLNAIS